jgi:DNA mismatch endonuclease, patch repair protein
VATLDALTPERRSENMRRIRSKGMKPELAVRRLVHGLGYRYRLHQKTLPGKPDLVFPSRRKVILVHGCFWHQHSDPTCKITRTPKSNTGYWGDKLKRNVERDSRHVQLLLAEGWEVLTVWECQIGNAHLSKSIVRFLDD